MGMFPHGRGGFDGFAEFDYLEKAGDKWLRFANPLPSLSFQTDNDSIPQYS